MERAFRQLPDEAVVSKGNSISDLSSIRALYCMENDVSIRPTKHLGKKAQTARIGSPY
jgi:hypothetical protein